MNSKIINIPDNKLDKIINKNINQSEKIIIVVSFIFVKGLELILDELKKFHSPKNITIITSNYLKSTEPKALRKLMELKSIGSSIYLFDSLTSRENFHIKSYYFENERKDFFNCIIGSSNMSYSAFKISHELNIETKDKKISQDYKEIILKILSNPYLLTLTEQVIYDYEKIYEENKNLFLISEDIELCDLGSMQYKEPNIV